MTARPLHVALAPLVVAAGLAACQGESAGPSLAEASEGSGPSWELVYDLDLKGDDNAELFLVSSASSEPRQLTDAPGYDGMPRYTPDGERIIFSSERTGHWQLFDIPAEGGEARRLRTNDATEYQADPSPDGKTLAFLTDLDGPERLVTMDFPESPLLELVRHKKRTIFGNPSWSPDGSQIAFSSNWRIGHQIYVVDVKTKEARRISALASGGCEPRFMPDGRVCYVNRGHMGGSRSTLVAVDLETGNEEVIVDWPALNYDPAFNAAGTEIAFASNITGNYAIYRQRLSDGKAWRVTFGEGDARYPDYRPSP